MTSARTKAPVRQKQTVGICPVCGDTKRCSTAGVLSIHNRRTVVKDRSKIRLWMVQAGEPITNLPGEVLFEGRCPGSGAQVKEVRTMQ